jgi:hypothetical protein
MNVREGSSTGFPILAVAWSTCTSPGICRFKDAAAPRDKPVVSDAPKRGAAQSLFNLNAR